MNRKCIITMMALAAGALCLTGCSTNTVKHSWKSPACQGSQIKRIAVIAVDEREYVRPAVESRFVRELRNHGKEAITTQDLLGLPEIKADKNAAAARLVAAGADAVMIVRLADHKIYADQLRADPAYSTGYTWYDYYLGVYLGTQPIWGNDIQEVYLDCNLFDLKTGERLWSALTETVLNQGDDRLVAADVLIAKLVKRLSKDGVVPR